MYVQLVVYPVVKVNTIQSLILLNNRIITLILCRNGLHFTQGPVLMKIYQIQIRAAVEVNISLRQLDIGQRGIKSRFWPIKILNLESNFINFSQHLLFKCMKLKKEVLMTDFRVHWLLTILLRFWFTGRHNYFSQYTSLSSFYLFCEQCINSRRIIKSRSAPAVPRNANVLHVCTFSLFF